MVKMIFLHHDNSGYHLLFVIALGAPAPFFEVVAIVSDQKYLRCEILYIFMVMKYHNGMFMLIGLGRQNKYKQMLISAPYLHVILACKMI